MLLTKTCGCLVAAGLEWVTVDQSNYVDLQLSVVHCKFIRLITLRLSLLLVSVHDQSLGSADLYGVPFVLCFFTLFMYLQCVYKPGTYL